MSLPLSAEIWNELSTHLYKESYSSDELILWCPFCDDKERHNHGHLYLNKTTQKWHCFSCDKGGHDINYLLKAFGITVSYIDTANWIVEQYARPGISILNVPEAEKKSNENNELCKKFHKEAYDIDRNSEAYRYLSVKRKLSDKEIDKSWRLWDEYPGYVFWFCTNNLDGTVIFYSGRAYIPYIERRLRYLHAPVTVPLVLVNTDKLLISPSDTMRRCVFIVEGIFDALLAPGPAIPMFSKNISNKVIKILSDLLKDKDYAVICTPDTGELESALTMARTLTSNSISEIYLFDIRPYKDFGEGGFINVDKNALEIYNRLTNYNFHLEDIIRLKFS